MESGVTMKTFGEELFKKLDTYEWLDNIHDVNSMFNDCLWSLPKRLLPLSDYISAKFIGDIDKCECSEIGATNHVFIDLKTIWPMSILFDKNSLHVYNKILRFVFKVKWALYLMSLKE